MIFSKLMGALRLLGVERIDRDADPSPMIFPCGVSRSGTTLLSAALDAHSRVCMGYEMLFPAMQGVGYIIERLREVRTEASDLRRAGSLMRKRGLTDLGKWISRCHRLGLGVDALLDTLDAYRRDQSDALDELSQRLRLIKYVLDVPGVRGEATHLGFKISDYAFNTYRELFPKALFVYIVRDPRDIYASLRAANFGVDLNMACKRWVQGSKSFMAFERRHPGQCCLVRYEDLVRAPGASLAPVFAKTGLEMEDRVIEFHNSGARILGSSHPNSGNLKKGFFESSVGRYARDLTPADVRTVEACCGTLMERHGYKNADLASLEIYDLDKALFDAKQKWLSTKRKSSPAVYENLLSPYLGGDYDVMTLREFYGNGPKIDKDVLIIRHDVDHDHLTARKIARWEYERGIRSTYCLLHTAWYYGELVDGRMRHSSDLVETVRCLVDLGHEINFHNNLVVTALKHNIDPVELLRKELDFFRSLGAEIKGTSTHGDGLCRELNFRNWELFKECCGDRFGGPRTIEYSTEAYSIQVELGRYPMGEFGLEYEAYDSVRHIYHTDSGGRLRTRLNARGHRSMVRLEGSDATVVGVLTHPIWWDF